MKIIFLDVDGVLNNRYTEETYMGFVFIEDEKIKLLKEIVDKTGANIVLSSSWRDGWRMKKEQNITNGNDVRLFEALQRALQRYDIELFDYTEDLENRGMEIDMWLNKHNEYQIKSFVILDDLSRNFLSPHGDQLISTDPREGLTCENVEKAIQMLNGR